MPMEKSISPMVYLIFTIIYKNTIYYEKTNTIYYSCNDVPGNDEGV